MKTKQQVSSRLVKMMVTAYGTIEAARDAYRQAKQQLPEGHHIIVRTDTGNVGTLGIIDGRGNQLTNIEWMFILP